MAGKPSDMERLAGGELWNGYIDDLAQPNCQMFACEQIKKLPPMGTANRPVPSEQSN